MAKKSLKQQIGVRAGELGFDVCRITAARLPADTGNRLETAIGEGWHASMGWLETTLTRRKSPEAMWPQARAAILLGMNYGPATDPLESLDVRDAGTISVYARNRDYHDIIKGKLKLLAGWLAAAAGCQVKVFVDTAPLMEKPLAQQGGAGWQGKHTNLVSREYGSWLFLGAILADAELEADKPESDHCGSCRACIDICPTDAFPAPYQLDARRCISYLTIEHEGPVPRQFRKQMGNRIFGCDDCLAVCPWNKYARRSTELKLVARKDLERPPLAELAQLNDSAFRKKFSASPVKRIGRNRFMRNVLVAIGNSGMPSLMESAHALLDDPDPVVRGSAVWASSRLLDADDFGKLREQKLAAETEPTVREEWMQPDGC